MKKLKYILFLSMLTSLISCTAFVEYVPRVFDGNKIIQKPELLNETHQKNVIRVLEFYKEDWKLEGGKLYISSDIDDGTLWNYTTKADDSVWLLNMEIEI